MPKETISQRLNQIMNERNLKQIDIIRLTEPYCNRFKIRIGRNDLSQYISGKVEPRQNKIYILAKALDVNEAWLMGFDVPKERDLTVEKELVTAYPEALSDTEKNLLTTFKKLSTSGKEKVIDYTELVYNSENTAE